MFETPDEHKQRVVHRASLLRELLAPLPGEILHANKQLDVIEQLDEEVVLTFKDGSRRTFDAVIGADGIFGTVRSHVLGDDSAKLSASPAGFWDCRALISMQKAKEVLGPQYFQDDRQYGWNGDGGFVMHDVLENGSLVQCVMAAVEDNPSHERSKPLTKDFLTEVFSNWLDGPIAKGMIEVKWQMYVLNVVACVLIACRFLLQKTIQRGTLNGITNRRQLTPEVEFA